MDSTLFENEPERIDERLRALTHSNFRMSWHLKRQQVQYIQEKGLETIARHCDEMIALRLAFTHAQQHYVTKLIMTWINQELSHWQLPLSTPTKAADRKRPPKVLRQKKADDTSMNLFG